MTQNCDHHSLNQTTPENAACPTRITGVSALITPDLLARLKNEYLIDWNGLHGFSHWCRVRENGLFLAEENGANKKVVEYFAFFHDNQRWNDGIDPDHGRRVSQLIRSKFVALLDLTHEELDLLCQACDDHNDGQTEADITIQTCWDADRLDLLRAGIQPDPQFLCTREARRPETIRWATERSLEWTRRG
ncbi:MAG TPA: hypothetical protein PKW33_20625 [Anaerolineaceae bacterium]|nr:hypothetical protein [Anaerolineaceae bacterium]HPN54013.1 hypothetical protein [Anaerolineaceae bacterium]